MKTTEINGITYEVGKLDTFNQLHVSRRLAPLLAAIFTSFATMPSIHDEDGQLDGGVLLALATGPAVDILAKMTDEDVDYIVHRCLAVCQRKQEKGWAKVTVSGRIMFSDIELDTLIGLTIAVVEGSLSRFFPTGQPQSQTQE